MARQLLFDGDHCLRSWSPPEDHKFLRGAVGAIVRWRKAGSREEFQQYLRRDDWETVLPELVFE